MNKLISFLSKLFRKKPLIIPLPYPEEKPDYTQTPENISVASAITLWLTSYNVPFEFWGYWGTKIEITLTNNIPYPAATYELNGKRYMKIRPEWVNHMELLLMSRLTTVGHYLQASRKMSLSLFILHLKLPMHLSSYFIL